MSLFKEKLAQYQEQVNSALLTLLPSTTTHPTRLYEAMHYAALMGGKRVRPALVYATGEALGIPTKQLNGAAAAIECIHAYSLVHDDLPAMDDDDLRRGQATCHIQFDEATAILAADALQALAFDIVTQDQNHNTQVRLDMCALLAHAAGAAGMVGGQAIDCLAVDQALTLPQLTEMHKRKTGALIEASVKLAIIAAKDTISLEQKNALEQYVNAIGLAFQVQDDILDITSDTATLGKTQGADIALNKPTFVTLLGLDGAQDKAQQLYKNAINSLEGFDNNANFLRDLAGYIVQRNH